MGSTWTAAPPSTRLEVYLNDHLAGARGGIELLRRTQRENRGTPLGDDLAGLLTELIEDRRALERLVAALGLRRNPAKETGAWALEKVARLKLNGQVRGYSRLSRLIEIEALCAGVDAKHSLWTSLDKVADHYPPIRAIDPLALAARASRQRARLEEHRLAAATQAFLPGPA